MSGIRLTNAPTNALQTPTDAYANAPANAPTNDTNALRTRPPIPPRPFVRLARALYPVRKHTLRFASGAFANLSIDRLPIRDPRHDR